MKITKERLKRLIREELLAESPLVQPQVSPEEARRIVDIGGGADDPIWDEVDMFLENLRRLVGEPITPDLVTDIETMVNKLNDLVQPRR